MNVVIIPARGGSKGIPQKNIVKIAGKPLIAWSIEQSRNSRLVDLTFVSTENDKIAEVARKFGAEVVNRPYELAADASPSEDAILHAIDFIETKKKINIDNIIFLQATSPLREAGDIDNAIKIFCQEKANSLFSCTKLEDYFIWEKKGDNYKSVNYDYTNRRRRQDISAQYLENGSIYIFKPEVIKVKHNRLGGKIAIYEMDAWKSFQIDDIEDLGICEYYIKKRLLKKRKKK